MANLSWEDPYNILAEAEAIVSARSPYAESEAWALTRTYHDSYAVPIIEQLQALPTGSRVLDVGPGYGTLSAAASIMGHRVTALELWLEPLAWGRVEWVRGDVCDPQALAGKQFDFAIMAEVLEHLCTDPAEAFCNVAQALDVGGGFCGSTPDPVQWPGDEPREGDLPAWAPALVPVDEHVRLYYQADVAALLAFCGFEVLEQRAVGANAYRQLWRAQKAVAA